MDARVTCDSGVPVVTAHARRGPAVTDAVRTQHGPSDSGLMWLWTSPTPSPHQGRDRVVTTTCLIRMRVWGDARTQCCQRRGLSRRGLMSHQMVKLMSAGLAGLIPVSLAVMLQLTTGEPLPTFLGPYVPWSWPAVAILATLSAGLTARTMWQASDNGSAASLGSPMIPDRRVATCNCCSFTGRREELAELHRLWVSGYHILWSSQSTVRLG